MAEYTFLLGSGISKESGIGTVNDITQALFNQTYYEGPDESVLRLEPQPEHPIAYHDFSEVQSFLKLILDHTDSYLKKRLNNEAQANFEDIYFVTQQLNNEAAKLRDNVAIKPFYDQIENESLEIRKGYHGFDEAVDMSSMTSKSLRFIESIIKHELNFEEIKGLKVISDLLINDNKANFFTLNHDLLIEALCDNLDIKFDDGFSDLDGEVRWYKPETWDRENRVKLYKLHGSKNWSLVRSPKKGQEYAILNGKDKWNNVDEQGDSVELHIDYGYLLTGQNKAENYNTGLYGEIHTRFSNKLKKTKNLIISGYGWNDLQLNRKIFDWLDSNEERKIILIHKNPKEMTGYSRHLNYNSLLMKRKFGQVYFIKKWFQDVAFDEVKEFHS